MPRRGLIKRAEAEGLFRSRELSNSATLGDFRLIARRPARRHRKHPLLYSPQGIVAPPSLERLFPYPIPGEFPRSVRATAKAAPLQNSREGNRNAKKNEILQETPSPRPDPIARGHFVQNGIPGASSGLSNQDFWADARVRLGLPIPKPERLIGDYWQNLQNGAGNYPFRMPGSYPLAYPPITPMNPFSPPMMATPRGWNIGQVCFALLVLIWTFTREGISTFSLWNILSMIYERYLDSRIRRQEERNVQMAMMTHLVQPWGLPRTFYS